MFGTKLRTWMETHIVRSRKKQQRNKEDKKTDNCGKLIGSSPACHIESNSFERQYGKKSSKIRVDAEVLGIKSSDISLPSKASMSFEQSNTGRSTVNNLSSPESAYSTGYSTDGTSPGASIPPEYYINIRTGTHYFHSNPSDISSGSFPAPQNTDISPYSLVSENTDKVGSVNYTPSTVSITVSSPRPGRHKRDDEVKKKLRQGCEAFPESSTEEDTVDKLGKVRHCPFQQMTSPKTTSKICHPDNNNLHRRTESYDESHQRRSGDSGDSTPLNSYQCTSPYLPGASPRQRNRIRTNPWLGTNHIANGSKAYNSQGETSSTVGSSSTLSSSGCKHTSDDNSFSPRSKEKRRLAREHFRDIKNCNTVQQSATIFSPVLNVKKHLNAVTTCSPQPDRSCHHVLRPRSPVLSSSTSSAPSSASEDDHHGNTSDFSDDDVTLNEMLGKFDESYVYEKETDILSDSDPTDCEDQADDEDRTDNSNLHESEQLEDLEFIDNGSLAELVHSDSECSSKAQGHCTYHLPGQTPEASRRLTPRLRESISQRQSASRRERQSRKSARSVGGNSRKQPDSPLLSTLKRSGTYVKSSSQSLDNKNSCENIPKPSSPLQLQSRRSRRGESVPRPRGSSGGKHINLNRVLMERLINNQRNGTRSADGTPISLRKRNIPPNYNGKYIKNQYVTNLISSDANSNDRRSSFEVKHIMLDTIESKPRSNSLSVHSHQTIKANPPCSAGGGLNDLDKEGDLKYRQLIQEAEHIIEDLQIKSKSPQYLSPTFRCKNGMERAKINSPLVFSVPPSPLSLRHDVYSEDIDMYRRDKQPSNNNSIFEKPIISPQKEKHIEQEESLLKTISKTLERIIIRGTSDTNRKLDKSVSDPFAKNKKKFALPSNSPIYSNIINKNYDHQNGTYSAYATPNLLRRSSTGNAPLKLSTLTCISPLNQNEISNNTNNHSGFRRFFRRSEKYKTSSFDEHLDRHNFPENGFCLNVGINKPLNDIYDNRNLFHHKLKHDVYNTKHQETSPKMDYSPNGNTPYPNGFQQIPWQHRTSQAERLKHLSDLRNLQKHKTDTLEAPFDQKPPLVGFQSVDLGNKNTVGSGYCPQSEPVKRKVYTCSATFEKLQKTLLRKQPEIHPCEEMPSETERIVNHQSGTKSRVAPLRRGRVQVESKGPNTQVQLDRFLLPSDIGNG